MNYKIFCKIILFNSDKFKFKHNKKIIKNIGTLKPGLCMTILCIRGCLIICLEKLKILKQILDIFKNTNNLDFNKNKKKNKNS
jgi:hypothetical protein